MASGGHGPSTPRKCRRIPSDCPVRAILGELNSKYNLDLEIRDSSTLTPSARKERAAIDHDFRRWHHIEAGIRVLLSKDERAWQRCLHAFGFEARAASQGWIFKPFGDPDTLPSCADICKATTRGEQLQLQELLWESIDAARAMLQLGPTPAPARTALPDNTDRAGRDGPAAHTRPTPSRPKRPSTESELVIELETSPSKRFKSQLRQQDKQQAVTNSIDKVPIRTKVSFATPQAPSFSTSHSAMVSSKAMGKSFYDQSANTSKSSFQPSIFSADYDEDSATQQTQTTVDSNSQRLKLQTPKAPTPAADHSSSAFFSPTPGDLAALRESFSRHEQEAMEAEVATIPDEDMMDEEDPRRRVAQEPKLELPTRPMALSTKNNKAPRVLDEMEHIISPLAAVRPAINDTLQSRLIGIWPTFPSWLRDAPMCIVWELTRICLHCGIDMGNLKMDYDPAWAQSYRQLMTGLRRYDAFAARAFPEPPTERAWQAATQGFRLNSDVVILSGSIDFTTSKEGPLVWFRMNPLKLEKGCRLNRRFGGDRVLDILMPQLHTKDNPEILKKHVDDFIRWLTREKHSILGRKWSAFSTMDGGKWEPVKNLWIGKEPVALFKERLHFFAELGDNLSRSESIDALPVRSASEMLDWLLQVERNAGQPFLKLFSRIALGLSKTDPTVVFELGQIIHHDKDILSPTGVVMNDGIGRMSLAVAQKIQEILGLLHVPSAVQARLGSAKGMWIVDVTGRKTQVSSKGQDQVQDENEIWIETYPSQRKWKCDQLDPYHRTLEINDISHELRLANLNLQFLPILEDRAKDKRLMRETIRKRMVEDLRDELETRRASMNRPSEFRQWMLAHGSAGSARAQRVEHGMVPFVGGLPKEKEEMINFLLDGGFDPKKLKYLQELAWELVLSKSERLKTKLNIRIGRSAYIYMIIDFWGILEEGEVHLGFSSKFQDERSKFAGVLLHNVDVLVARSPAHLISDVQKVRAVFKPELLRLTDVIVFSAKGNTPLADKLSGGDYDGDKAWVCWDTEIVNNFHNAVPDPPTVLSEYLVKDKTTFGDLVQKSGKGGAIGDMIEGSFHFNMGQSLLGICTNYKERLCYQRNRVNDPAIVALSTLLSNLVDQPKQGIKFAMEAWNKLKRDYGLPQTLDDPAYKGDNWSGRTSQEPPHIIDYMKFAVVKPTIDHELEAFHNSVNSTAHSWDPELAKHYESFEKICLTSGSCQRMLTDLENRLGGIAQLWADKMGTSKDRRISDFSARLTEVYDRWVSIRPNLGREGVNSKVVELLTEPYLGDNGPLSSWSLLKASTMYRLYYDKREKMVWRICGRQLQYIKAMVSSIGVGVPTAVTPLMYAGLTVDKKFVAQYVALSENRSTEYYGEEDEVSGEDVDS